MTDVRSYIYLSSFLALSLVANAQAPADKKRDQLDMEQAEQLAAQGKYAEAVALYQGIQQNYPTSAYIPGANLGAAVNLFFMKDYDKAAEAARKNFTLKTVPPEILERCYVLVPQILSTKAAELPPAQTEQRKKAFGEAIKGFEDFMAKYPKSPEVETALYGKGRALAQIEDFEGAAAALKQGMDAFPRSQTILDTKFLRGLVLQQAGVKAAENTGGGAQAKPALDEAEKTFKEIIAARSDLALINSSFMQLGDVYALKASMAPKDSDEQKKLYDQALEQYRYVSPKEIVVKAQEDRIKFFEAQAEAVRTNIAKADEFRQWRRVVEKQREKLAALKEQPDASLEAKLKGGQIFLALGKFDEARVLLKFVDGYLTDDDKEAKKRVAYFTAVTYAAQHVADKAVEAYEKFKAAYGNDPIAETLPLLVGAIFNDPDPKLNNPDKAISYFDEQVKQYPKSKLAANAVMQKTVALITQKKLDEALKSLNQILKEQTDKDLLKQAEFALGTVQREMGKNDEAIKTFKSVREKYPNTEEAEQASFWVGQITGLSGDAKTSLAELTTFVEKHPKSNLMPSALYFKARAEAQTGERTAALASYEQLTTKFPQSEPAQPAMFEMASMLQRSADDEAAAAKPPGKPNYEKVHAVMRKFIETYPQSDRMYSAYDFSAQLAVKEEKLDDAIKTYEEYIAKHSDNPDVAKAHLSLANILKTRAEKLGPFLAMGKDDQTRWKEWMDAAVKNVEQGIEKAPESNAVSQLLDVLLKIENLRMLVGLKKADDLRAYFDGLAGKFEGKSTKTKILFALANFLADNDREKKGTWFDIMDKNYDASLVLSPTDMDRYGNGLIERKKYDKANEVALKVAADYPVPKNSDPTKVTRNVGDAQAVSMALRAKVLQGQGKAAEGQKILEELKKLYPWSAKVAEADFGIGAGLAEQKKYEEAIEILSKVAKNNAAPVKIRAQAMMIIAKCLEEQKAFGEAINNYIKIATFFESERDLAAEGLWRGAQLMEDQASGKIPPPKPTPKPEATPKGQAKPAGAKPGATPGKVLPAANKAAAAAKS